MSVFGSGVSRVSALMLALALAVPAFAPVASAVEADDALPGVGLPVSPVNSSVDAVADPYDIYYVALTAGESLDVTLTGDPGTDFDVYVYPPDWDGLGGAIGPVAGEPISTYPEHVSYNAPTDGSYYVLVDAFDGAGNYQLDWATGPGTPPSDDDSINPNTPFIGASGFTGFLDDTEDPNDAFRITLAENDVLTATLTSTDPNNEFKLFLFDPQATDFSVPLVYSDSGAVSTLRFAASTAGDYVLDLYAMSGYGDYTLDYTITQETVGENNDIDRADELPASPYAGNIDQYLDVRDVFKRTLIAGQTLEVTVTPTTGVPPLNQLNVEFYNQNALSVLTDYPLEGPVVGSFSRKVEYDGTYYVNVETPGYTGPYAMTWRIGPAASRLYNLSVTEKVAWGGKATVSGQLINETSGLPLVGKSVKVQYLESGQTSWKTLATKVTDAEGFISQYAYPKRATTYRLAFDGDADYAVATETVGVSTPYAYLSRPTARYTTYKVNQKFAVSGYLKPYHVTGRKDVRVLAYRKVSGVWKLQKTFYATNAKYGTYTKYTTNVVLPARGSWMLKARVAGDTVHLATLSTARYMTVK